MSIAERALARHREYDADNAYESAPPLAGTVNLTMEYPQTDAPAPAQAAASIAMATGKTHYVAVAGIADVRASVARFLAQFGMNANGATDVLVTAGEQEARFLAIQSLVAAYGPLAVPAVVHPGVTRATRIRRLAPHIMPVDGDLQPTLDGVRSALEHGARVLFFETPNRMTGALLPAAFVSGLSDLLTRYDAYALLDIGFLPFAHRSRQTDLAALVQLWPRALFLGTPYPGGGADAWLVGYLAGPAALIAQVAPLKQITSICTCAPAQWGVAGGEEIWPEEHAARVAALWSENDRAAETMGTAVLPGASANVIAMRVVESVTALARLQEAGFTVTDGTAFGAPDTVRVSVTATGTARGAVNALKGE